MGRTTIVVVGGRAKISKRDNTSLLRLTAPDVEYDHTPGEIGAIVIRFREVGEAGALNSAASWGGVGFVGLGSKGLRESIRRPQG
jgi:hypothetical protein